MIHVELSLWQGLSTLNINNLIHYCSQLSVLFVFYQSLFNQVWDLHCQPRTKLKWWEGTGGGGGGRGGGGRGGGGRGGGRGKTVQNQTNSKSLPIDNMCELLTTPLNVKNDEQPPDCCVSRHTHLSWFVMYGIHPHQLETYSNLPAVSRLGYAHAQFNPLYH